MPPGAVVGCLAGGHWPILRLGALSCHASQGAAGQQLPVAPKVMEPRVVVALLEVEVNAPPSTVWQIIAGTNDWRRWNRGIEHAERLTAGNWTPGFRFVQKSAGERMAFTYAITSVELGRRAAWSGTRFGLTRGMSIEVRPHEGGSEVHLRQSAGGPWTRGLLGYFVARGLRRSLRQWADGLRRAVATMPSPGGR